MPHRVDIGKFSTNFFPPFFFLPTFPPYPSLFFNATSLCTPRSRLIRDSGESGAARRATLCRCLPLYSFSQMRSEAVTSLVECAVSTPFCAVKRTRVDPLVHARRLSLASVHHRSLASPRSCLVESGNFKISRDLSSSKPSCFQLDRMNSYRVIEGWKEGSIRGGNNSRRIRC